MSSNGSDREVDALNEQRHPSRGAARRYRRKLATGWRPAAPSDPLPPVEVLRRGVTVIVERTVGTPRLDLFAYDGQRIVGLTALAVFQGYRLPCTK